MDPQLRMLLEVTYEAIVDAGINPSSLRGTACGVFVGCAASETFGALTTDADTIVGYTLTGCQRSMFANRISYFFDLHGPSFPVDTACSSSLLALQVRSGFSFVNWFYAFLFFAVGRRLNPSGPV
jgi:fatty acid synthase